MIEQNTIISGATSNTCSAGRAKITFTGRDLYSIAQWNVIETNLAPNSMIFVDGVQSASHALHLVVKGETIPLPIRPNMHALQKQQLYRIHHHPEVLIAALECFLKWRFNKQSRHHQRSHVVNKILKTHCTRAQRSFMSMKKSRQQDQITRCQNSALYDRKLFQRGVTMQQISSSSVSSKTLQRLKSAPTRKTSSWHDVIPYTRSADLTTIAEHPDERLMLGYINKNKKITKNSYDPKSITTTNTFKNLTISYDILKSPTRKNKMSVKFSDNSNTFQHDNKNYRIPVSSILKHEQPGVLSVMTGRSMFTPRWSMLNQGKPIKHNFTSSIHDLRPIPTTNYNRPTSRFVVS